MANHTDRSRKKKPRNGKAERAGRAAEIRQKRNPLADLALVLGGGAVGGLATRILTDASVTPRTASLVLLGTGTVGAATLSGPAQVFALGVAAEAGGRLVLAHMVTRERGRRRNGAEARPPAPPRLATLADLEPAARDDRPQEEAPRRNGAEAGPLAPPHLSTLADLQPAARDEGHGPEALATLGDIAAPRATSEPAAALRNAGPREHQLRLREDIQNLIKNFGYRDEIYDDPVNPPRSMPYLPMPFAAQMLTRFEKDAKHWLGRGIPDNAKQPTFIKNRLAQAREILGVVKDGVLDIPNPESYEDAPPAIAAKVPGFLKGMVRPDVLSKVLKLDATARFLDKLHALAMHFDALAGQPSKLDLFSEAAGEQAEHVAEAIGGAVEGVVDGAAKLPGKIGKLAEAGASWFKWGALAALAVGLLLVVKR